MKTELEQFESNITMKKIYLRSNLTKKGFDFQCAINIIAKQLIHKCRQLSENYHLIQQCFLKEAFSERSKYILIHTGQKIYQSDQIINLETSNILYIVNKQEVQKPLINLNIRLIGKNKETTTIKRITSIQSVKRINEALQESIALNFNKFIQQVDFFHLGKILSTNNYFCEEYIQDEVEIICIDKLQNPVQKHHQKQITPLMVQKKKFIVKQQSIQILGITEQPYKPTISFNQIANNKINFQGFEYDQQIVLSTKNVFNAGAMDIQYQNQQPEQTMIEIQYSKRGQTQCLLQNNNIKNQKHQVNTYQNSLNSQKQEIKTQQQIEENTNSIQIEEQNTF